MEYLFTALIDTTNVVNIHGGGYVIKIGVNEWMIDLVIEGMSVSVRMITKVDSKVPFHILDLRVSVTGSNPLIYSGLFTAGEV